MLPGKALTQRAAWKRRAENSFSAPWRYRQAKVSDNAAGYGLDLRSFALALSLGRVRVADTRPNSAHVFEFFL